MHSNRALGRSWGRCAAVSRAYAPVAVGFAYYYHT